MREENVEFDFNRFKVWLLKKHPNTRYRLGWERNINETCPVARYLRDEYNVFANVGPEYFTISNWVREGIIPDIFSSFINAFDNVMQGRSGHYSPKLCLKIAEGVEENFTKKRMI